MGLFRKFQPFKKPLRTIAAISTFGSSEVFRALPQSIQKVAVQAAGVGASLITANPAPLALATAFTAATQQPQQRGEIPMALPLGNIFGQPSGASQNPYLAGLGQLTSFVGALRRPPRTSPAPSVPVPHLPAPAVARAMGTVGRGFFAKYPNLATSMQMLRNQGRKIKRSQLYSMLRRFGPEMLVTGGILTAAAITELIQAGPGHRRMNPANAKALRRAGQRIKGFHKLCQLTDLIKPRRRPCPPPVSKRCR